MISAMSRKIVVFVGIVFRWETFRDGQRNRLVASKRAMESKATRFEFFYFSDKKISIFNAFNVLMEKLVVVGVFFYFVRMSTKF